MKTNKAYEAWIAKQAIWHDSDMVRAVLFGIVIGVGIGFLWGYSVGLPDLSGMRHIGIRG